MKSRSARRADARKAARLARHVVVEVPLEANRSASRPAKRAEAARIGHVHAFDRADVRALCGAAGLTIEAELTDPLPYAHHAFFARDARSCSETGSDAQRGRARHA